VRQYFSANKLEHWYIRHNNIYFYICWLHVWTYTQVIFRPSCTCQPIKAMHGGIPSH